MIAAAVVEVQMCVDDDVDAGEIEFLLAQWPEAGIEVGHRRVQLRHAGVDQHARIGMVDDVHVDRHPLALGEQVGHEQRRDCGRRRHSLIRPHFRGRLLLRSIHSGHLTTPCAIAALAVSPKRLTSHPKLIGAATAECPGWVFAPSLVPCCVDQVVARFVKLLS